MLINQFSCFIALAYLFLLGGCKQDGTLNKQSESHHSGSNKTTIAQLTPVVFGGNRYIIEADFGLDEKVPLMVHGNARLYLMLTHDVAEKVNNGNPVEKISDYGYSKKGRGKIHVQSFSIATMAFNNIDDVPVFDWPEEEGKAAQGMLGINFLEKEKIKIDFVKEQLEIGVAIDKNPDKMLVAQGYTQTQFFIENGESYMMVYFDALKKEIPITIGTVSDGFSLDLITFGAAIQTHAVGKKEHSPNGTTPEVYTNSNPITFQVAGKSLTVPAGNASLYSFAEYENVSQAKLFPFGIFGRDWMKENGAIIDYANKQLYFKPMGSL